MWLIHLEILSPASRTHSIEIQVDYFEREDGVLTKVFETVLSAKNVPLSQTLQEAKCLAKVQTSLKNLHYDVLSRTPPGGQ